MKPNTRAAQEKVEPIKSQKDVLNLKRHLKNEPRNLAIFTLGINTALRASDILALKVGDLADVNPGDQFEVKERKTKKRRIVTLNHACYNAIWNYLDQRTNDGSSLSDLQPLFLSRKGSCDPLTPKSLWRLMVTWCDALNLSGNYGSHTLRKTFGYHQRVYHNRSTAELMSIFNHTSERETLDYLCIQAEEIKEIYMTEI